MNARILLVPVVSSLSVACHPVGCLDGSEDCVMPSPCEELLYTCEGGSTSVHELTSAATLPGGATVLASPGDVVLANDQVIAVIDALDHPHYLAPTGGSLIDLFVEDSGTDSLRQIFQAMGLLPWQTAYYTDLRILEDGDVKAVQLTGHLDGAPEHRIATRYEIRPCEPGIRVRTEVVNLGVDPEAWTVSDGFYFGDRESVPFTPAPGAGFEHPSFGLSTVPDALVEVPYMVAGLRPDPSVSYATVACNVEQTDGFHSAQVSATGLSPSLVMPRDWRVYERFIAVSDGPSVAGAADVALEVRRQLFDEPYVLLTGRLVTGETSESWLGTPLRAEVVVSEGTSSTPDEERIPRTHVRPDEDGRFSVYLPTDRDYVLSVDTYGRRTLDVDVPVADESVDVGSLEVSAVGEVTLHTTVDGEEDHPVLVFVLPADDATEEAVAGQMFGNMGTCAPLLGHPHGNSPACNRILVTGTQRVGIPEGTYDFFAAVGPFSTLAVARGVDVVGGAGQSVELDLETVDIQPTGTLSGDFHVHGGPSFDAGIGDLDRVRAFLASGIQVIASTEHDVAWDYADAIEALGAEDALRLMVGTEATGHILFRFVPDDSNPKVVGHWNLWPLPFDPEGPWRGAPWDEKAEPAVLFDRAEALGWSPHDGVAQLNHPISGLQLGRAYGWIDSLEVDGTRPLIETDDGTGQSLFFHQPEGSAHRNSDYHVQEVMNGSSNQDYLKYRAFWFYLMNQGIFRSGTANSDSHTLTENVLGTPRTLVSTSTTFEEFDPVVFNGDLKDGRAFGTNGPVLLVETTDVDGGTRTPSLELFEPASDGSLSIEVSAAPWVPVDEVRIYVNGELVKTVEVDAALPPDTTTTDPAELVRLDTSIALDEVLPDGEDAWLVVEAGSAHREAADLDCNGFPDTTDNNGDGTIDWQDVEDLTEDPKEDCFATVGPLHARAVPDDRSDPLYVFATVVPDGYPLAFSNPFVFDGDGDGDFVGVAQ